MQVLKTSEKVVFALRADTLIWFGRTHSHKYTQPQQHTPLISVNFSYRLVVKARVRL